jgi:3-oxoadipate enol-lactonase
VTLHHELTGRDGVLRDPSSNAPAIVLSNSIGTDLSLWDAQVPVLNEHFRVLRYDQHGHGRSPAAQGPYDLQRLGTDVLGLLDRAGIERAHFAGVSLGGMSGMWLAEHAADRIDRLALVCTSARLDPDSWQDRAALVRSQGMEPLVEATLDRWFTPAYPDRARFGRMLRACDPAGYAGCCEAISTMDILDGLGTITAPTLVIAGRDDPATPPAHAERIAAAIPGARLEILPDAAHLANAEQAEAVNRLFVDHFGA